MIGHFEQLPDELLLDLFEHYVRLVDLYVGFSALNHGRMNRLIACASLHLHIPSKDIFHAPSISHFASQIVSIRMSTFATDLDLSKFVHLRSLHMEKPTRSQLAAIRAEHLPHLSHLSLWPCWYSVGELPQHLLDMGHFPVLRRCVLSDGRVMRLDSVADRSSSSSWHCSE